MQDIELTDSTEYYEEACNMYPEKSSHLDERLKASVDRFGKCFEDQKESMVAHIVVTHGPFVCALVN